MKPRQKIRSSIDLDPTQKKAMQVVTQTVGVPMTNQIKIGLDGYLFTHQSLLKKHNFVFTESGVIEQKPKK